MKLTINGVPAHVDTGTTVAVLVAARVEGSRHVAVAVNGAVVPRAAWPDTCLQPGDTVEVLAPVAGG